MLLATWKKKMIGERPWFAHLLAAFLSLAVGHALVPDQSSPTVRRTTSNITLDLDRQLTWSRAAFRFISSVNCRRVTFTAAKECQRLTRVDLNRTNVYLALPSRVGGKVSSVFPDSGTAQRDPEGHDGVLAVDPYPEASFGHLVVVFYVDLELERTECEKDGGVSIEGNGDCLQVALQRRCRNFLMKRKRRRNFARRCEINFLPLVHFRSDVTRAQRLVCRPDLGASLFPCPAPASPTTSNTAEDKMATMTSCDPLRENTKRCETSHEIFESACHVLKICDQAILVSGGWNPWSLRKQHADNVRGFYRMLRRNGFHRKNVKVFYADGRLPPEVTSRGGSSKGRQQSDRRPTTSDPAPTLTSTSSSGDLDSVHPATESKMAMRYEIQRLCSTAHCVDSFVLYLNSPSTYDGDILLWDVNRDGLAEPNERYSVDELMSDLADCKARHLHVIVDQSYSGAYIRAFRRARRHPNAVVCVSGRDVEYSYAGEFTKAWTQVNHTNTCTRTVFKRAKRSALHSTPMIYIGDRASNVNIYGAPCDVRPPLTQEELNQNYLGCQNLPWTMRLLRSTTASPTDPLVAPSHVANGTASPARRTPKRRHRVNRN